MKKFFSQGIYNEKEAVKIRNVFDKLPAFREDNSQVFFDLQIGEGDEA